ncbi:tolloid-like protein 1 isoform X1 [Montipora capricornis]|uniref:tolloid-like protein 1 isoform X1 n=1 Tax=Montipora capricornis TaxID=246305 RepID=UPI0035F1C86F
MIARKISAEELTHGYIKKGQQGALHLCYFVFFLAKSVKVATEQIEVTKWEDTVSSPNFPQTYPTNSNISWIISVSSGNRIEIHIFSVQTQCDGDYLQIRDGKSMTSPLVGRYCGNNYGPFPVITSSGTYVLLQFVSDNTTDGNHFSGFTLRHTGLCHLHLNSTNGVITTPNHPNQYPNFLDCLWMIQLHPSVFISVECHDFALEQKEGCLFDYMEVLAGVSSDAPVIKRYCGIHNETLIFARQGNISIKFVSDKDKEFGGFRCTYKVSKVRGEWTNWTNWTECSRTCHHGNQTRYRACVNPLPESELQLVCDDVPDIERRDCFLSYCNYSTSSMVKRTVSGERGLFTTTASALSSVTKHSSFRENHGTVKRTETRKDLNSIRVNTYSRYRQITPTTNKHHYGTIPLSSGITASYSFTGNNWKSTTSAAVIIAVDTDDFETRDHPLSLLFGVNVSSSYATSAWKNTRATRILTSDQLYKHSFLKFSHEVYS